MIEGVSIENIAAIAQGVYPDSVFFVEGTGAYSDEEGDENE